MSHVNSPAKRQLQADGELEKSFDIEKVEEFRRKALWKPKEKLTVKEVEISKRARRDVHSCK